MELNEWYDFYFEHKGKCPECGNNLIMYLGCIGGWDFSGKNCSIYRLTYNYLKTSGIVMFFSERFSKYRRRVKKIFYEREQRNIKKNLDIQGTKTYYETNY